MLVCQCNIIASREIERVIRGFLAEDPWQIIVPAKVYRALDKRCKCSGCVPNVVDLITRVTAEYHRELEAASQSMENGSTEKPTETGKAGGTHEGRSAGHRAA